MSKRAPGFERHPLDFYATPAKAVPPLVPFLRVAKVRRFSEPCAGDGALVRHLESFGLICAHASDVASGQDALTIQNFDAPIVTNPPYERKLMHALIWQATAPCVAAARIRLDRHETGGAVPPALLRHPMVGTSALDRSSVRCPGSERAEAKSKSRRGGA